MENKWKGTSASDWLTTNETVSARNGDTQERIHLHERWEGISVLVE
jgi:hypothetical protein